MASRIRFLLLCCSLAVGCSSAPPPPPQFALDYLPHNPGVHLSPVAASLGVARMQSKAFYTRERVAWRAGDTHQYHAGGKWEDSPAGLLAEAVLDAATESGAFVSVRPHPPGWGDQPLVVVRGRIVAFDDVRAAGGRAAVVSARIALTDATGRMTYWEGDVEQRHPVAGSDMGALIEAFRSAQARVADDVVAHAHRVAVERVAAEQAAEAAEQAAAAAEQSAEADES